MSVVEALNKHDLEALETLGDHPIEALGGNDRGSRSDYSHGLKMRRPFGLKLALKNASLKQLMGGHTPLEDDEYDGLRPYLRLKRESL